VQNLLDWFEVDLGFTELSFIQIDLCVLCVFCSLLSQGTLSGGLSFESKNTALQSLRTVKRG